MSDTRDVSQLRVELKDYILDSEAEIRSNLKLGLWRGQNDPIVVKMQKVVDDLIARVREEMQPDCVCKCQRGYAAALRDAVKAVYAVPRIGWPRERVDGKPGDRYEEAVAVDAVVAAIEALGGER